MVCLSTDKAVYPVNAMGMSKALMEKVAQAFARNNPDSPTTVSITRYGNVMYSRGSVIPLFVEQLRAGRPLTITDPTMTRFLMSLERVGRTRRLRVRRRVARRPLRAQGAGVHRRRPRPRGGRAARHRRRPRSRSSAPGTARSCYETLLSREELVSAEDRGEYFRVPLDARVARVRALLRRGRRRARLDVEDYTSHNTRAARRRRRSRASCSHCPSSHAAAGPGPSRMKIVVTGAARLPRLAPARASRARSPTPTVVPSVALTSATAARLAGSVAGRGRRHPPRGRQPRRSGDEVAAATSSSRTRSSRRSTRPAARPTIVFANCIQAATATPYGDRQGSGVGRPRELAARASARAFVDVVLPNLFGEHGRPALQLVRRDVLPRRSPTAGRPRSTTDGESSCCTSRTPRRR